MAIVTTLTFNSTAYDVSDYVMRHSIEIDEQLFNPDNLKPTTNRCDFKLSRSCPYIDELFAWTGDVEVSIVADGVAAFTGYLTDNYGLKITARGASDISLSAEDPGIKKLKTAWVSTGALVTVFAGDKVCDPADTANSFVHILAGLAGVTLATTLPTISDTVYFSVQDKDRKQYWDILEKVLLDYRHVFYFDATGKLALFALDGLTGTASQYVCTNGTILQKSPGDPGVEIKKRLIQYKEVIVNFDEGETLASATVFRDTTGQGLTDCEIEIAAGAYYPTSCDASTYAYIDYFLEDGREIKAVDSITADFSLDSGITYELTNLGTSAQIRFYNPTGLTRSIRKLKITGTNVLAVKADSKVTSTIAGGKKLEYDANYITELADAQSLANLLRYYYANSGSLYTFRAYAGTLYPSDTLFPSDTLYPLGDTILLGDITRLHDPVWTGLDVNCGIYRKKYVVGKAGATFDAVGIGTITLGDAVSIYPIYQPNARPIVGLYPTEKALTNDPAGATPDTVDFDGQYGIYGGQRYVGTTPTTWTLDDAGLTEAQVETAVTTYAPRYLGKYDHAHPSSYNPGDWWLVYDNDDDPIQRGVWYSNAGTPARITTSSSALLQGKLVAALSDIAWAEKNSYGLASDYGGFDAFFTALGAVSAYIASLYAQSVTLAAEGYLESYDYAEDDDDLPTAGFKLDVANQLIKSYGSMFTNAYIKNVQLVNAVLSGILSTSELETKKTITVTWTAPGEDYYFAGALIEAFGLSVGQSIAASGTFNGKTVVRLECTAEGGRSGPTVYVYFSDATHISGLHFTLVKVSYAGSITVNQSALVKSLAPLHSVQAITTDKAFNCYNITPASLGSRSSGTINAGARSSEFTVYKPITVYFASGDINSFTLELVGASGYYTFLVGNTANPGGVALNPGKYVFHNVSESDSQSVTLLCVGAYGTADGSSIWS